MDANLLELAIRKKFRFNSAKGMLSLEDLWDLPLTSTVNRVNLDDIARELNKQLKSGDDISFVHSDRKSDVTIQAKFDLVIDVIKTLQNEANAAALARDKAEQKQRLMQEFANRKDGKIKNMSDEELEKALAAM